MKIWGVLFVSILLIGALLPRTVKTIVAEVDEYGARVYTVKASICSKFNDKCSFAIKVDGELFETPTLNERMYYGFKVGEVVWIRYSIGRLTNKVIIKKIGRIRVHV